MIDRARSYQTKVGGYPVRLTAVGPWKRTDFAWLGTIDLGDGHIIGWAWHEDGRSIDRGDRGFDLVERNSFANSVEEARALSREFAVAPHG